MNKPRKRRPRARFYVIVTALAAFIVILVIFIAQTPKTAVAEQGEIRFEQEFDALIIREEKVYEAENYGKAVFIAAEGERIKKGERIAEVYKWGYNDKVLNELIDLQKKIKDYQVNNILKDVLNPDLTALNQSIDAKALEVQAVITGAKTGDAIALERELKALMTGRQDYLRKSVKADEELEALYEQEQSLVSRINGWKLDILAESDGMVSFYFDGNEKIMNPQNMDKLTIKNIEDVLKGVTTKLAAGDKTVRPLYRLANNFKWYVQLLVHKPVESFRTGTQFTLVFEDIFDKQYQGTLQNVREDKKGQIYTFLMQEDIGPLLSARRLKVKIIKDFAGLKLPEGALRAEKGENFVEVKDGTGVKEAKITVLTRKEGYAVVEPVDETGVFKEGALVAY